LFSGGGIIARIMKAKAEFFAACWSYVVAEQNILLKVSEAYLDYLLADDLLHMEEINSASLDMLFKASNVALSTGVEKPGDRSIAAGQALMQGASKVIEAQRNKNTMLVKLQSLVGAPVEFLEKLVMPTQFTDLPKNVKALKTKILESNPSIKASMLTLSAKKHEVISAQSEFLPKIELEGAVERKLYNLKRVANPSTNSTQFNEGTSSAHFGVGLRVPIYDRGLMHANLRISEQEVKLARLELEQNKRTVLWEGVQQWNTLYASIVNQSLSFRGMLFYTQALMNAQKEYDVGVLNIIDFSRVQENWIAACRTWITQRFAVVKSSIAVAAYLGKVTAQKLKLPVALFNPKKYYEEYATRWTGIGADESENALFELDPLERKE
jgi:outer membrane protein TolC